MDQERIDNYNSEVTQWISKQGVFFQIFHASKLVGSHRGVINYAVGLFFKVILVCLALLLGLIYYEATRHNSEDYRDQLVGRIVDSLKAEEFTMALPRGGGFSLFEIPELDLVGSESSFFDTFNIQNVEMDLGNFVARKKQFYTGNVTCSKLDVHLKISENGEGEDALYGPLFQDSSWFEFEHLEARVFNCSWGYSEKTKGEIKKAQMSLSKRDSGWVADITGGTMNYGWLKDLNVISMKMVLKPGFFEITEAIFEKNGARVTLELKVDDFGVNPQVSGSGEIRNCNLDQFMKPEYNDYLTGVINSSFVLKGSPNASKGVGYIFKPLVGRVEQNGVVTNTPLRNEFKLNYSIPIWRALSTLDTSMNYRSYVFNENDWEVELDGDVIYARDVLLSNVADERLKLALNFAIKQPSDAYIEDTVSVPETQLNLIIKSVGLGDKAKELLRMKGGINASEDIKLTKEDYVQLLKNERHFSGQGDVLLHENGFNTKKSLQVSYPLQEDGYRHIEFQLDGPLKSITAEKTESLYKIARKDF